MCEPMLRSLVKDSMVKRLIAVSFKADKQQGDFFFLNQLVVLFLKKFRLIND